MKGIYSHIIFGVAIVAALVIIVNAIRNYKRTDGEGFLTAFRGSLTVALADLLNVLALLVTALLADDQWASAIGSYIPPALVPLWPIAQTFLLRWARTRSIPARE